MMLEVSVATPPSTEPQAGDPDDAASGNGGPRQGAASATRRGRTPAATKGTTAGRTGGHPVLGSYGRVAAWLSKRVEVALNTVDLTLPQYRVLGILAEGSSAASGLAERLAVRRPSITAIIDGLVARQLVDRRHEDSDRRRVALRLTEDGVRTLAAADEAVDSYLAAIAGHLPTKEEAMALRALELWGKALTASREGPRPNSAPTGGESQA